MQTPSDRWSAVWGACLVVFLAGCEEPSSHDLTPTIENVQAQVFDPHCAGQGCHDADTQAGELDLSSAERSYANLVGVDVSNAVALENGWVRVRPGDLDRSFLLRKLEVPGVGEGAPMPPGGYELTQPYLDLVSDWIVDAADREDL